MVRPYGGVVTTQEETITLPVAQLGGGCREENSDGVGRLRGGREENSPLSDDCHWGPGRGRQAVVAGEGRGEAACLCFSNSFIDWLRRGKGQQGGLAGGRERREAFISGKRLAGDTSYYLSLSLSPYLPSLPSPFSGRQRLGDMAI